jgi:hypothetical protein
MQQRANTHPFQPLEKRRIALALQGGGSHAARNSARPLTSLSL